MNLYRSEALTHKIDKQFGKAFLHIPRSYMFFTLCLVTATFIFTLILYIGDYTRKETVQGVLVPSTGIVRIYAPRSGEVEVLNVDDGQNVYVGQSLLRLRSLTHLASGETLNRQQQYSLTAQLAILTSQVENEQTLSQRKQNRKRESIKEHKSSIRQLRNQLEVSQKLAVLKRQQYQRTEKLAIEGYLTEDAKNNSYQQLLIQQQSLESNKRLLIEQQGKLKQLKHELAQLPLLLNQKLAQIRSQQAELSVRLSQLIAQESEQLKASIDARVTAIQVHSGEQIERGQLLMTLLPRDTDLEAELYVPSRAAGFMGIGQTVRIRYGAFPYQRYGIFNGTITEISEAILTPEELRVSVALSEAVYRVRVTLAHQSVSAFGKENQLQPGMQLDADIMLDTMSLLDWVMMPIYAINGRL